ncbi:acyl-CoA dehydrogenase family protein [Kitasatospora sp. NPDC059571]|uniref:acyl-CoA dehydrogenase family protein n=1 Tax=Kitasatospora sp. NPDC059571 TaxID=3346871 RepID=UPI0036A881EC
MVGAEGGGTELVLKALQISRTLCPSLSLGAMDAALRLLVRFSRERELYGRRLADLPLTRRTLADAYADLLLCEALSTVATRSIQALPGELSITAAVAKYLVPTIGDEVIGALGHLLGARSFLADHYAHGMFQKIARDHRIVGIFDGNTLVNLYSLVAQFRGLARGYRRRPQQPLPAELFGLDRALPPFAPDALALVSRPGSSVLGALPDLVAALREEARERPALGPALAAAEELAAAAAALHESLGGRVESVTGTSPESFEQARAYTLCFAGAAALGLWLHNHDAHQDDPPWRDGRWLHAVLDRVLRRLPGPRRRDTAAPAPSEELADALTHQYEQGLLFSLLHCPIAEGPPSC